MEDEKKKKRQKKKKNKQGKTNESTGSGVGEPTSENNNHVHVAMPNHQNLNSKTADVQTKALQTSIADSDSQPIEGTKTSCSVEAEKSYWLDRESSLEQKIKELQEQLDMHKQKEADLERNVAQSQKEKALWHHKEAELGTRILHLQTEKDSWLRKEVSFKEKLAQMEEEKVTLAQRENSAVETIASLNKDNARLRAQVIELEASRNDISHQNQQLEENVSDLRSKIQNLENSVASHLSSERTKHVTESEDLNSQLEAAQALVEKLLSENEQLVEKVNNLNAKLDQKNSTTQSSVPDDPIVRSSEAAATDESSDPTPSLAEGSETVGDGGPSSESTEGMLSDEGIRLKSNSVDHMHSEGCDLNPISRVSMESGEIVQIPLDENDVSVPTSTTSPVPEKADVPLTDAPLIGAPFRLISFVARYVSGADLIDKS